MNGWVWLLALLAVSLAGLRLLGLRGPYLTLAAAALFFGCAGYALQGSPGLAGSARAERQTEPPMLLADLRQAFFGQFTSDEAWLRMSDALARRGKTEESVGAIRAGLREHPDSAVLWVGLGNALVEHVGSLTPASEYAFQRAEQLAPGHPAPPFFMGLALARSGDGQSALALWKQILRNAPAEAEWRPMVEDAVMALSPPQQGRD
jgi:cytochrome c-type biogenesis protein CcmH